MIDTPLARHWFMHTPHTAVGLGTTAKINSARPPLPAITLRQTALPAKTRTLRVGLIAGPEATWTLAAERVAEHLLRDQRLEVDRAWDCAEMGIDELADYDTLVLLGWPAASRRDQIKRIELYCRGGGSLVALRAMHAEIPGWSSYAEEVFGGRQLPGGKCRLMEAERSQRAWHHPVVQGIDSLIVEGEVYSGPRFSPDVTVLLTAHTGQPVAWTTRHEGGRVFCSTLGLEDDFREPRFLRLISNAVHWTGLVHG